MNQLCVGSFNVDHTFMNEVIETLRDIASVLDLHNEFKNENDLTWLLQIDENDLALRSKDFLNMKELLE